MATIYLANVWTWATQDILHIVTGVLYTYEKYSHFCNKNVSFFIIGGSGKGILDGIVGSVAKSWTSFFSSLKILSGY